MEVCLYATTLVRPNVEDEKKSSLFCLVTRALTPGNPRLSSVASLRRSQTPDHRILLLELLEITRRESGMEV